MTAQNISWLFFLSFFFFLVETFTGMLALVSEFHKIGMILGQGQQGKWMDYTCVTFGEECTNNLEIGFVAVLP